jgi:hypothetical protein
MIFIVFVICFVRIVLSSFCVLVGLLFWQSMRTHIRLDHGMLILMGVVIICTVTVGGTGVIQPKDVIETDVGIMPDCELNVTKHNQLRRIRK